MASNILSSYVYPFLRSTRLLSVMLESQTLEGDPPFFKQNFTYSILLLVRLIYDLTTCLCYPISIASTLGLSFDFSLQELLRCFSSLLFLQSIILDLNTIAALLQHQETLCFCILRVNLVYVCKLSQLLIYSPFPVQEWISSTHSTRPQGGSV